MMDMNDAHRLRPPSPLLDVLSHFVASRRTWQAPAQTNILFVFGVFVLFHINCVPPKWAVYQSAAQTNILAAYLIFVIFFTRAKFLENKIYTENANFLH